MNKRLLACGVAAAALLGLAGARVAPVQAPFANAVIEHVNDGVQLTAIVGDPAIYAVRVSVMLPGATTRPEHAYRVEVSAITGTA